MEHGKLAPVVLFVFNRPEHTRQVVEALAANDLARQSRLFVFSDGPRDAASQEGVEQVRSYIRTLPASGLFAEVIIEEAEHNLGLAQSVIQGVSHVLLKHGRAIMLEDDALTAPDFLIFMNSCLEFYKEDKSIGAVSGYSPVKGLSEHYPYDVYKVMRNCSIGWATWGDRWSNVDWELEDYDRFRRDFMAKLRFNQCGSDRVDRLRRQKAHNINSWSIRFGYHLFRKGQFTIYPTRNRIRNIGNDGTGVHGETDDVYNHSIEVANQPFVLHFPKRIAKIERQFRKIYSGNMKSRVGRFLRNNGFEILQRVYVKLMSH